MNSAGNILIAVWIASLVVFVVVTIIIGGDAINGKTEGGHYYLYLQGHLNEVSSSIWHFDRTFTIFIMIVSPLSALGGTVLKAMSRKRERAV
jgi:hypothetical protein